MRALTVTLLCMPGLLAQPASGGQRRGPTPGLPSAQAVLESAARAMGGDAAIARIRSVEAIADGRSPRGS
jgi:hypothetical protein